MFDLCPKIFTLLSKNKELILLVSKDQSKLPDQILGNDIDLLVESSAIELWINELNSICENIGCEFKILTCNYYVVKTTISHKNEKIFIDLNYNFMWYFYEFAKYNDLLSQAKLKNLVFELNQKQAKYFNFCLSFLYGGFINEKYITIDEIFDCRILDKFNFNGLFNPRNLKLLLQKKSGINCLRIYILSTQLVFNPLGSVKNIIKILMRTRRIRKYVAGIGANNI